MYSDDFILKSSIVEQVLCKRTITPLLILCLEDCLQHYDACRYKWLLVGFISAVASKRYIFISRKKILLPQVFIFNFNISFKVFTEII